ncbi:RNA polymerase sigma factor [uncultured Oscillibacter sp.]|uniref:RNA polymerase sigma factor n=1 Tax=uncultured Oscillibacter sp. TaxID=876091 RepID=UPI0025E5CA4E|nr:RNA polymerase sigma factor [uncultured Oscillibacter sp.]
MSSEHQRKQVEEQVLLLYPAMYRLAFAYVKNRDDAMDVVQESACKAIAGADALKNGGASRSWLFRITVNAALDVLRRRGRETAAQELPETGREDAYRDLDTLRALDALDERERTVVVLRFFEDLKLQEIADVTGENLNTVKTVLYRSLKKLKIRLTEGGPYHGA